MRDQSSHSSTEVEETGDQAGAATEGGSLTTPVRSLPVLGDGDGGYEDGQPAALALRSEPASARLARRFVDRWLGDASGSRVGDDLQLVTSELVTNAVRHSSLTGLRISRDGDCVLLEVDDEGGGEPVIADRGAPTALSGRGLVIVDRLVHRWGWLRLPDGGKRVWCALCPALSRRS